MVHQVGIVGAGALTRIALAPALLGMPDARVAAVLDPDPLALRVIAELCPGAVLCTDEEEFFAQRLDAVHVATPNHLHEHYACRSLRMGLATIVDKPLAHTPAAGQRIVDVAAQTGTPALIGYMAKYNVANVEAQRLVSAGAIGTPRAMVAARLGWRKYDWRVRRDQGGLGCLADLGIYPVLTAVDLFGAEPVRCQASAYPLDDVRTEVYAQATLWFDERRYLHFETSFAFDDQPASAEVSGYTLVGDEGVLQVQGGWAMNGGGTVDYCDATGWHRAPLTPVDPYVAQYRQLIASAAGAPVPPGLALERGRRDLEILYAISDTAAAADGPAPIGAASAGRAPVGPAVDPAPVAAGLLSAR
jgi:predicted dehydrogenase